MTTPLIPDLSISRRLGSWGDLITIQVLDGDGTIVDLTTATAVQIKIEHDTISSDSVVRDANILVADNGEIYYVIQKDDDFTNVGKYKISSIVSYAVTDVFPDGKLIISYKTTPNFIMNLA